MLASSGYARNSLTLGGVYRILDNPVYHGIFERPRKSGNWYEGKHTPIITKELFDKAQAQLKRDQIVRESKEFAFTKLFTSGLCGSGISAQDKYKRLKMAAPRNTSTTAVREQETETARMNISGRRSL